MDKNAIEKISTRYALPYDDVEEIVKLAKEFDVHYYDVVLCKARSASESDLRACLKRRHAIAFYERWMDGNYEFNTDQVRALTRTRQHFLDSGVYTFIPRTTYYGSEYARFWFEEKRRSIYGYVDIDNDIWVPGYYYFYLNFSPILKVVDEGEVVDRIESFPDFRDADFFFFLLFDYAERHGLDFLVLKARGTGFSYKAASMGIRNFVHIPRAVSMYVASEDKYLTKDGTLNKVDAMLRFVNDHTEFGKRTDRSSTLMHKMATVRGKDKTVRGYRSEIIGYLVKKAADVHALRGTRFKLMVVEEAATIQWLWDVKRVTDYSKKIGKYTVGTRLYIGTGGEEGAKFEDFSKFFYNPDVYGILGLPDHVNREADRKRKLAFFLPVYLSLQGFIDEAGNSLRDKALAYEKEQRENLKKSGAKPNVLAARAAEAPIYPDEAIYDKRGSIFPVLYLRRRLNELEKDVDYDKKVKKGRFFMRHGEPMFIEDLGAPLLDGDNDYANAHEAPVIIYKEPKVTENNFYGQLYVIGVDPVDRDFEEVRSDEYSLGAAFVLNVLTREVVAEYVARPMYVDDFYMQILHLALYYRASVMYENNIKGLFTFFKSKGYDFLLANRPEILSDTSNKKITFGAQKKGYTATAAVVKLGLEYIIQWLGHTDKEGYQMWEKIPSKGLLRELIRWTPEGNYDRVSAMIGAMFALKERERSLVIEYEVEDQYGEFLEFLELPFKRRT